MRSVRPKVRVVVGGYDPSLAPEAYMNDGDGIEFIVRGEGEVTFRELLRALESGSGFGGIAGLTYRDRTGWQVNPARPVHKPGGRRDPPAEARGSRAERLHHAGAPGGCGGNLAGMHV